MRTLVIVVIVISCTRPLTFRPLLEDNLCYFARRLRWTEEKFFRFAADKNQAQIYLRAEEEKLNENKLKVVDSCAFLKSIDERFASDDIRVDCWISDEREKKKEQQKVSSQNFNVIMIVSVCFLTLDVCCESMFRHVIARLNSIH